MFYSLTSLVSVGQRGGREYQYVYAWNYKRGGYDELQKGRGIMRSLSVCGGSILTETHGD